MCAFFCFLSNGYLVIFINALTHCSLLSNCDELANFGWMFPKVYTPYNRWRQCVYVSVFFSLFLFFWLMCLNVFTQTSLRFKAFKKTTFPWFFRSSVILSKHKYIYVNSYNAQYVVRQVFLFRSLVDLLVSVHIFCSCLRVDYTWVARWLTKILFVNESKAHDIQKTKYGNSLN